MRKRFLSIASIWIVAILACWGWQTKVAQQEHQNRARQALKQISLVVGSSLMEGRQDIDLSFLQADPSILQVEVRDSREQLLANYSGSMESSAGVEMERAINAGNQDLGSIVATFSAPSFHPLTLLLPAIFGLFGTFVFLRLGASVEATEATEELELPILEAPPMGALTGAVHQALYNAGGEDDVELAREISSRIRHSSGTVLELGTDMRITSVGGSTDTFGYSKDELIGRPVDSLVGQFEPNGRETASHCHDKGGARRPATVSAVKVNDAEGNLEKVIVLVRDSSGSSEHARERLQRLEGLYRSLCDNANDLILVVAPDGAIVYANPSWCSRTGYSLESTQGQPLLLHIAAHQRLVCQDAFHSALQDDAQPAEEFCITSESGEMIPVEGGFHCSLADDGQTTSVIAIFRDLTEEKKAADALHQSEERFRHSQKMEAIGRLAGGVAHDFNNLLTVMFSCATFIESDIDDPEEVMNSLKELKNVSKRAADLTRQLLLFSRRHHHTQEAVNLNHVVRETTKLADRITKETVEVKMSLDATEDVLMVESGRLEQVLMNLIINANDACEESGVIEVSTTNVELKRKTDFLPVGNYVKLLVKDNGCGIGEQFQERVFEPYFTTKEVGEGTGLGLSTVYAIIKACDGHIEVESEPGEGTTFTILLPLESASTNQDGVEEKDDQSGGSETVLVVEDEAAVRSAISNMLKRFGYSVELAEDGEQGWAKIQELGPQIDLVVTDLVLPKLSGPELAQKYLGIKENAKILYVSGYPSDVITRHGLPGDSVFLPKPFRAEQLGAKVRELLDTVPA